MSSTNLKNLLLGRLMKKYEADFPEPDIAISFYRNMPESEQIIIYNLRRTAADQVAIDITNNLNRTYSYYIPLLMPSEQTTVAVADFKDKEGNSFEGIPDFAVAHSNFGKEQFLYLDKVFRKIPAK